MASNAASRRDLPPPLRLLETRQQEDRDHLAQVGDWIAQNPPWLVDALRKWLERAIDEKGTLLDYAARTGEAPDAAGIYRQFEHQIEDALAREEKYITHVQRLETERDQALTERDQAREEVRRLQQYTEHVQREMDALRQRVVARSGMHGAAGDGAVSKAVRPSVPQPAALPSGYAAPPAGARPRSAAGVLAAASPSAQGRRPLIGAYIDWCRTAGMLAGRLHQFAEKAQPLLPHAAFRAVYRDLDSPTRPVVFTREAKGAAPAEYWLVEADGERWLFPQPQSPHQFRDLAPVFEGQVAPRDLHDILPARVQARANDFEVVQPGLVR